MALLPTIALLLASAGPDPSAILANVDEAANRAKDAILELDVSVSKGEGQALQRKLRVWQLGADKRLIKFLAPSRLRGIGILVPKAGQTYLYHPTRNKIRRIVGKGGGGSFEGTGFSINDLARVRFSQGYTAAIDSTTADIWVLTLTPRDPSKHVHATLEVRVRRADHLVTRVVSKDATGTPVRIIAASDFRKTGAYTVAHRIQIDEVSSGKKTVAVVAAVRFDTGLGAGDFTERQLRRIY